MNKVILMGNVGNDPELSTNQNGTTKVKLSIATSEKYKNKDDEWVETTEWHNVFFYGGRAATIEKFVKKGTKLVIEGSIKTIKTDDEKYYTFINGSSFHFTGGKKEETQTTEETPEVDTDDLPF